MMSKWNILEWNRMVISFIVFRTTKTLLESLMDETFEISISVNLTLILKNFFAKPIDS